MSPNIKVQTKPELKRKEKTKTNLDLVFSAVRNWVTCDYVGNLKTGVVTTEKKINTYYWE